MQTSKIVVAIKYFIGNSYNRKQMFSSSDKDSYDILIILIYTVTVKLMRSIVPNQDSFDRMMVANTFLKIHIAGNTYSVIPELIRHPVV